MREAKIERTNADLAAEFKTLFSVPDQWKD